MGKAQRVFDQDLPYIMDRAAGGASLAAVAREFGTNKSSLHRTAKRNGLRLVSSYKPGRVCLADQVADMKPAEAVRYLLDLVESLFMDFNPDPVAAIAAHGFTAQQARLLLVLVQAGGRAVSLDHLTVRLAPCAADPLDGKQISVVVCKVRKRLAALGWPVQIVTIWGHGFRFEILDPAFSMPGVE